MEWSKFNPNQSLYIVIRFPFILLHYFYLVLLGKVLSGNLLVFAYAFALTLTAGTALTQTFLKFPIFFYNIMMFYNNSGEEDYIMENMTSNLLFTIFELKCSHLPLKMSISRV